MTDCIHIKWQQKNRMISPKIWMNTSSAFCVANIYMLFGGALAKSYAISATNRWLNRFFGSIPFLNDFVFRECICVSGRILIPAGFRCFLKLVFLFSKIIFGIFTILIGFCGDLWLLRYFFTFLSFFSNFSLDFVVFYSLDWRLLFFSMDLMRCNGCCNIFVVTFRLIELLNGDSSCRFGYWFEFLSGFVCISYSFQWNGFIPLAIFQTDFIGFVYFRSSMLKKTIFIFLLSRFLRSALMVCGELAIFYSPNAHLIPRHDIINICLLSHGITFFYAVSKGVCNRICYHCVNVLKIHALSCQVVARACVSIRWFLHFHGRCRQG